MKSARLILLAGLVAGCGVAPPRGAVDQSAATTFSISKIQDSTKSAAQLSEENQKLIEAKLEEVLNFCLPRLSGYEAKSADQAKNAYWLSMSGLVAGSVLAPGLTAANASANASWTAALSGWSGATNFAGEALKTSGLSGSFVAETRNNIIKSVRDQIAIASDGAQTFEARRNALMKARAECIVYEIAVPSLPAAK